MNKFKKYLLCLVGILLLLPTAAYADYSCNFESGADDWICTPSGFVYDSNGNHQKGVGIIPDPDGANNKVLLIDGTPGKASARINFEAMQGIIDITFRVRFAEMGTNVFNYAGVSSADGSVIAPMVHNGHFIYTNASGTLVYTRNAATQHQWLNIRYRIDTGALTYSVYVNGGKYSSETQIVNNYPLGKTAITGITSFTSTAQDVQIYLDDVRVRKISDSTTVGSTWMYSKRYKVDYNSKTIGEIRYKAPKSELLNTIGLLPGVTAQISGQGDYFLGGETLTLRNSKTGTTQTYSIKVRTDSLPKLYNRILNDSAGKYPSPFKGAFLIK
jgi:hypothetical protein